jgi:uncharacterized membrane protein
LDLAPKPTTRTYKNPARVPGVKGGPWDTIARLVSNGGFVRKKMSTLYSHLAVAVCIGGLCAPASAASDMRGFVSQGIGDVLLFSACEGGRLATKKMRLLDKTTDAILGAGLHEVRQMMLEPERGIYAEFDGDIAGIVVTARRLQRVVGHIESCAAAPRSTKTARIFAHGEQPFWRLVVTAEGAQLEMEGQKKPVRFPFAAFKSPVMADNVRIYDAWSSQDGGTVRVEVEEQMCSDGRSETATGAKVTLRYGSQSFEGCATRF